MSLYVSVRHYINRGLRLIKDYALNIGGSKRVQTARPKSRHYASIAISTLLTHLLIRLSAPPNSLSSLHNQHSLPKFPYPFLTRAHRSEILDSILAELLASAFLHFACLPFFLLYFSSLFSVCS